MPSKDAEQILEKIRDAGYGEAYPGRNRARKPGWNRDPFHVLISTVLSQRTKDENTYNASKMLFSKYDTPSEVALAPLQELEELVRPAGFPSAKASAIKEIARMVHELHSDKVPKDIDILLTFPMVGRKTANCVLAYAFGEDAICVDTHVHRISNRMGLVSTKDPEHTEMALREVFPRRLWRDINKLLVVFGQEICRPRNPKCEECPVSSKCEYYVSLKAGDRLRG
ncbi:MAG: endonuclease III [Methanomassiliicoccales archaeon]|nr:endonuclease III [Methanomassiliicoccales archaeon]NYT14910.1 endonuclease III [Methanomassiliicoccales archaeon]